MNTSQMQTPFNRREFERNLNLLKEQMRQGKMHFSTQVSHTIKSLLNVRSLPNKRLDLLSIDESARLQANTMANMMVNAPMFEKNDEDAVE